MGNLISIEFSPTEIIDAVSRLYHRLKNPPVYQATVRKTRQGKEWNCQKKKYINIPSRPKNQNNGPIHYCCGESNATLLHQSAYRDSFMPITPHNVDFKYSFYIAEAPVTNEDYQTKAERDGFAYAVRRDENNIPCENGATIRQAAITWRSPGFPLNYCEGNLSNHPVVCVTWHDALEYIKWLNENWKRPSIPRNYFYTLPSEAMWEVACRAGDVTGLFFWGNDVQKSTCYINASSCPVGWQDNMNDLLPRFFPPDNYCFTSPVASYQPNKFGLCDMLGNVFEWCYDAAGAIPHGSLQDPWGADAANREITYIDRICRGGSWATGPFYTRCAYRRFLSKDCPTNDVGFRVALAHKTIIPENLKPLIGIR